MKLSDWGKLQAAQNGEDLARLVALMSIARRHPVPDHCWFETAHDYLDSDNEYAELLLKAAERWAVLTTPREGA